jgi:hypothetical protein
MSRAPSFSTASIAARRKGSDLAMRTGRPSRSASSAWKTEERRRAGDAEAVRRPEALWCAGGVLVPRVLARDLGRSASLCRPASSWFACVALQLRLHAEQSVVSATRPGEACA